MISDANILNKWKCWNIKKAPKSIENEAKSFQTSVFAATLRPTIRLPFKFQNIWILHFEYVYYSKKNWIVQSQTVIRNQRSPQAEMVCDARWATWNGSQDVETRPWIKQMIYLIAGFDGQGHGFALTLSWSCPDGSDSDSTASPTRFRPACTPSVP